MPSDAVFSASETADVSGPEPSTPAASFPVVGIGASAGGLEAFNLLLTALPVDKGMVFVFIQHMDPGTRASCRACFKRQPQCRYSRSATE